MAEQVLLYDTTLRDGMQGEGMSLSADEKVRVAHALDSLGVHMIEGGFPSSNPKEVALFEYPRKGAWSIVFIAKQQESEINRALAMEHSRTVAVFRPITPNVTTGYLLYVDERDLIRLDMSIEDAAKLLISAGLVGPEIEARVQALAEAALKARGKAAE